MNIYECETCIKRKTTYCPNSNECLNTENKPYYQNRIMLLEENEELKLQNFELREDIMINKMSFPSEKIKDKTFYNLIDMPSYEELNQKYLDAVSDYEQEKFKVEELKKQLQIKDYGFNVVNEEFRECAEENLKLLNRQLKFISYLKNRIKNIPKSVLNDWEVLISEENICEEILSKYKEIIEYEQN